MIADKDNSFFDAMNIPAIPEKGFMVLGIESSCDETGAAVSSLTIDKDGQAHISLLSDVVASSMEEHRRFGGVVPEIASRAHLEAVQPTVRAALDKAGIERPDAVAVTTGPGLAGALLVGVSAAKAYAATWGVPFYAINHLDAHIAASIYDFGIIDNAVVLLVSGGHTQLLHVRDKGQNVVELGSTLDDAAGEAYDKVARLLGLGYPGGGVIDKLAQQGNPRAINFPRGMMRPQDSRYDFSFSGLKTSVARYVETAEKSGETIDAADLCASFQEAVADVLTLKAVRACKDVGAQQLILGGGVAANSRLRELALQRTAAEGMELKVPRPALCTDNGAMVAALGAELVLWGAKKSSFSVATEPSLPVDKLHIPA